MTTHAGIKANDIVLVTKAHSGLTEGMILKVTSIVATNPQGQAQVIEQAGSQYPPSYAVNFTVAHVMIATRAKRADMLDAQAEQAFKDANTAAEKARALKAEARRLREFASDEEELADLLITVQDAKGTRASRVKKLAEILTGRIKTNHL